MRVLTSTAFDNCDDVWWRVDGEYAPVTMLINCNDLFYWACADAEIVTDKNIDVLEQSYKDSQDYGGILFCCRVRGMRPQGAYYKYIPKDEHKLFDACGPERPTGIGNPHDQSEYA